MHKNLFGCLLLNMHKNLFGCLHLTQWPQGRAALYSPPLPPANPASGTSCHGQDHLSNSHRPKPA